jgi:hypothetical protein
LEHKKRKFEGKTVGRTLSEQLIRGICNLLTSLKNGHERAAGVAPVGRIPDTLATLWDAILKLDNTVKGLLLVDNLLCKLCSLVQLLGAVLVRDAQWRVKAVQGVPSSVFYREPSGVSSPCISPSSTLTATPDEPPPLKNTAVKDLYKECLAHVIDNGVIISLVLHIHFSWFLCAFTLSRFTL